jgi:hypothetical protein
VHRGRVQKLEGRRTVDDRVGNSNTSNWWGMYAANGEEIAEGQHQTMLLATLDAPGVPSSPNFARSSESLQDLTPKIIGRANGLIIGATVPIECTVLVVELLRGFPRDLYEIWPCQRKFQVCSENSAHGDLVFLCRMRR